ncbi:hypothetical protein ACMATS_21095 [Streptoverticillium reticulum]|uniref:hypothetical protein n=1 Tax=Streptoverticillium reticulum TaxID=1433415 RepID=UPI0039BF8D95
MRFLSLRGPFCRNCGTAVLRDMTGKTLWQGWWSPISLVAITPFTLIWNLTVRAKLNKLPPPVPGQPGPQLDPGVPLRRRPVVLAALIPVAWVLFLVFQIVTHAGDSSADASGGSSSSVSGGHPNSAGDDKPQKPLKLGQPSAEAQTVERSGKAGKFTITPQKVVMGKPSDLDELKDKDKYAGRTIAWVYVNAKLVGGDAPVQGPMIMTSVGTLSGSAPGTKLLVMFGDLSSRPSDCKSEDLDATWQKGDEHTLCTPYLVPDGQKLTTVTYSRGWYKDPLKWTVD